MKNNETLSEKRLVFINYLLSQSKQGKRKLPPIADIAETLGLSIPNVREHIANAKLLGLVSIQPRTGIHILPFDFSPAISTSLYYAVNTNYDYFEQYSELRNQIEKAYFHTAVSKLDNNHIAQLLNIVETAIGQLEGNPIRIPHEAHKEFHLSIYKPLQNVFIDGLLHAYWDMYEMVGLNTYTDISYLRSVWGYHKDIAIAISKSELEIAFQLLEDHIALLKSREEKQRSPIDATKQN